MKTFFTSAAAIVATSLAIFACSGGSDDTTSSSSSGGSSGGGGGGTFSCDSKSTCPNEPALTAEQKQQCQQIYDGACGTEYKALGNCVLENEQCKADGTSDTEATNSGPCKTQDDAFTACFLAGFDGGQ